MEMILLAVVLAVVVYLLCQPQRSCSSSQAPTWISLAQRGAETRAYWNERLWERNVARRKAEQEDYRKFADRLTYYKVK